jgi:hypothetical protein
MGGTANTPAEAATTSMRYRVDTKNQSYTASSGTEHTVTVSGSGQHSTTEKKIGATGIDVLATNEKISAPIHSDFDWVGDFTVECWAWRHPTQAGRSRFFNSATGSGRENIDLDYNGTDLRLHASSDGTSRDIVSVSTSSHGITNSTWFHLAFVRNGNNFNLYINGVSKLSATSSGVIETGGGITFGGFDNYTASANNLAGYFDEIRVSNVARYTSNFTAFGQGGGTISSPTAFTTDANTKLLIHSDATNGSTTFTDSSPLAATGKITRIHGTSLAWS